MDYLILHEHWLLPSVAPTTLVLRHATGHDSLPTVDPALTVVALYYMLLAYQWKEAVRPEVEATYQECAFRRCRHETLPRVARI